MARNKALLRRLCQGVPRTGGFEYDEYVLQRYGGIHHATEIRRIEGAHRTFGSFLKKSNATGQAINANPHFSFQVKHLAIKNTFNKMVKTFYVENSRDRIRSGTGGKMNFKDEFLSKLVKTTDRVLHTNDHSKEEATKAEKRRPEAGHCILAAS